MVSSCSCYAIIGIRSHFCIITHLTLLLNTYNMMKINEITKTKTIKKLSELEKCGLAKTNELPLLEKVVDQFSLAISDQMYNAIDHSNPNDPIAKQFVPSINELNVMPHEREDPIGDAAHTAVNGIIHRYPDRCLFTPVHVCPVYCRFCFRREKVSSSSASLSPSELGNAFAYIQEHTEISEVILTGGDPLILKPAVLKSLINRLKEIDHVDVIRIHTRVPVVESHRITPEMIAALKCNKAVYVVLHANHPNEFTPAASSACAMFVDAGIPMLSQSVLLKDINNTIDVLSALMKCFIKNRIKPYYLHQGDLARGTQHFRTTIKEGQELVRQLRGRFSGLCQPTYVLDIPGGYGKVPIGPQYLCEHEKNYRVEDYQGDMHHYDVEI